MSKLVEEWRPIRHYEGLYEVSDWGRVRSLDRYILTKDGKKIFKKGRILVQLKYKGYLKVILYKNNKHYNAKVHRLVAEAFIQNLDNLPQVNHKDENPSNNNVDNLEWCTPPYNSNYGTRNERITETMTNNTYNIRKICQYTLNGELVKIWQSSAECGRNGFNQSNVIRCCKGGFFDKSRNKWHSFNKYKGYKWKYCDE